MAVFRTEYRLDVFMKRIVLLVGGVETLAYFSIQMGNEWKRMGYKVFYFDLEDEMNSAKKLRRFIKPGETVLVTFNFEGLEKEAGVYREGIGYVWDEYAVPCYNIAVDHPYYYHERLADLPKNITTSASTGCMRIILNISIRSLRTVDFFRLQEVV